ncbi:hypothetical protein AB0I28_30810 [Phytomonospora sp. NPDC050363]|uniref:hypothetical protein n=1 Tax=Phytomonospora sp. NPDC050363 TaxID=3155642 RepID=UPI00340F7684
MSAEPPTFAPVPLPVCDGVPEDRESAAAGVAAWIGSAPMRALVAEFGGRFPEGPTAEALAALDAFSAEHWDFRDGRERAEARRHAFEPATAALIVDAARALGLLSARPPRHRDYTQVLILGGMVRACLVRTRFAADLLAGAVTTGRITAVGGFRVLTPGERELAAELGMPQPRFEVDALAEGVRRAFGATAHYEVEEGGDPGTEPNRAWRVTTYHLPDTTPAHVVAAPSSEPDSRRANTADTCRYWADEVVKLGPRDRVLVVTSTTYLPFQHADAIATIGLPYGCAVDTVGIDLAAHPDERHRQRHDPDRCLQEIRSAIWSMRRLYETASA